MSKYIIIKREDCKWCADPAAKGSVGYCLACDGTGNKNTEVDLESAVIDIIKNNTGSISMLVDRIGRFGG